LLPVGRFLALNRRRRPQATAVVDEGGSLTHAELAERAWAVARGLLAAGVRPGDRVGILSGNSNFAAETYLGAVSAAAVAVPYNWRWSTPELVFAVNDSGANLVLVEAPFAEAWENAATAGALERRPRAIRQGPEYEAFLQPGPDPDLQIGAQDGNVVLYTGGTTGFPKGVLLSHHNVMANAIDEIVDTDMAPDDRTLVIAPMYHSGSLLCWFVPHLVLGACSVFLRNFDEERVALTIARERITNGFLVPSMVRRLLQSGWLERHDLRSYRRLYVGGATYKLPDKLAVREVLPDATTYFQYGLTEAGPIVTRLRPEDMYRPEIDGSIGTEILLNEVRVCDADGAELSAGAVGELCVRGPNVMLGYLNRAAETAAVFRGDWLRTGDLVSRDTDGYFYYHDRLKDMIKSGGENVYSAEVERVLYAHPAVAEAAVIGVGSDRWDEEVRAVVALKRETRASESELREFCRRELAGYKVPKRIAFIDQLEMPINPSGKIMKRELQQRPLWVDEATPG
jgi:fatty-acyl-CoA synthase